MKILLINHFPLEGSGSGTYTRDVAVYLHKIGHEVSIVFPENAVPEALPGVSLNPVYFNGCTGEASSLPFNFPCFTTHPRSVTTFADLSKDELEQYLAAFDRAITDAMDSFRPDIVHVQHIWILAYLALKHGVPCVITAHGTDLMGYEKWPQFHYYAHNAVEDCGRVISISKDSYRSTIELFPQVKDKILLLRNGYNDDIFYPVDVDREVLLAKHGLAYRGERIVLFAGKMTAFKGVDILLSAVQRYERSCPGGFITVIAGTGEEDGKLRRLSKELGLESAHFIGHKSQIELRELYSAADVFAMPSRSEAFGLVALEAMACGLPVVASNVGGLPDFISSEVGTLTPPCDPDALSTAIQSEIRNIEKDPERKSKVARYALEHYSMTQYVNQVEKIYLDLLNR
jgi:glycosyltransferase involved in cell wall biosynthesis